MHQARHDVGSYQRVEVITGARRRRSWSESEKARIVAESEEPEANVSEVARRNGVSRGLLTVWRRRARSEGEERRSAGAFAEVRIVGDATSEMMAIADNRTSRLALERIEIAIADATVRVPAGVDALTLERVLAALRSTR